MFQSLELSAINYCNLLISAHYYAVKRTSTIKANIKFNSTSKLTLNPSWFVAPNHHNWLDCIILGQTQHKYKYKPQNIDNHELCSIHKQGDVAEIFITSGNTGKIVTRHSLKLISEWRMESEV